MNSQDFLADNSTGSYLRVSNKNSSRISFNLGVHFNRIFSSRSFGVKCGKIALNPCNNGTLGEDRLSISIPYANQNLTWTIFFNTNNPQLGPDFDFLDQFFLIDPDLGDFEKNVPSLKNWNSKNSDSLLEVITELVLYYKKYQIDHLRNYGLHLVLEYEMLLEKTEICDQDVEIILLPTVINPDEIHFLIRIAVDFTRLPKKISLHSYDIIILHITYRGSNWNRITPQLLMSTNLEEIFGSFNNFHLPSIIVDNHLMDYVLEVKKLISNKIDSISTNNNKRREFINVALCLQGTSLIEYDNIEFNSIDFLLNYRDFYFFICFTLSSNFPTQPPKVTLQSCYHLATKDELYKSTLLNNNFPYDPHWEPEQMITQVLIHVIEKEISAFKSNSIKGKRN